MKMFIWPLLIFTTLASAQTPATPANPTLPTGTAAAVSTPAPAPARPNWRLSYFGDYVGPRLSNFSLSQTQGPLDPISSYTGWSHGLKIGYAVSPEVVLGTQIRGANDFDPQAQTSWTWKNLRFYFSWRQMIDTSDVDMQTVVDWELPTSTGAKNRGLLAAFNIKNNWTFKTSLRNWSFSAMTLLRPSFYENPVNKSDIYVGIFPFIQYDLADSWAIILEGSFDASHSYNDTFFDFGQDDPDNFNVGVQYTVNAHLQINPAVKFFTADFKVPVLYFAVSASL